MGENKKIMKKALSVVLAMLMLSVVMCAAVSAANVPVPENAEYISLDKVLRFMGSYKTFKIRNHD